MVRHLVGLGHRRIAFITGPDREPRRRGAAARLPRRRTGLLGADACGARDPGRLSRGSPGYDAAPRILEAPSRRPTAIFAANDSMAIGLLYALSRGRRPRAGGLRRGRLRRHPDRPVHHAAADLRPRPHRRARGARDAARSAWRSRRGTATGTGRRPCRRRSSSAPPAGRRRRDRRQSRWAWIERVRAAIQLAD